MGNGAAHSGGTQNFFKDNETSAPREWRPVTRWPCRKK